MKYQEQILGFDCDGEQLLGILSSPSPDTPQRNIGVVIVVGGPQYRVGSHRQFVLIARSLAALGYDCLRFDYRGMGDSAGARRDFLDTSADIHAAIQALRVERKTLERVVLWGLCDAASAILLYIDEMGKKADVDGICLLNPWVRTEASLAMTRVKHYYRGRLKQREFWVKLLSGKVAAGAIRDLAQNLSKALQPAKPPPKHACDLPFNLRMARAWQAFSGPVQLILSGADYTAKEFLEQLVTEPAWSSAMQHPSLSRHDIVGADHTFSRRADALGVEVLCTAWLNELPLDTASRRSPP